MLKIYTHPFSTPALSVQFTANAAGGAFENVVIDLTKGEHKKPDYLAINALGKVPALSDGDFTLSESGAIMRYIARREKSDLLPSDPKAQARVEQWMDYIFHHVRTPFSHVQFGRMFAKLFGQEPNEAAIQNGISNLKQNLPAVDAQLAAHPYLCGADLSLADIALVASLDPSEAVNLELGNFKNLTSFLKTQRQTDWYKAVHDHYGQEIGM